MSLLDEMLARRQERMAAERLPIELEVGDDNPPFDAFTDNIAYHWRRRESRSFANTRGPKVTAHKPERLVLAAILRWLKKIPYIDSKRVSVGMMRTPSGYMMNFGGKLGESDIVLTPHAGQPFERQVHVEVKRPDIVIDGKKVQCAGKQSDAQKTYQEQMESRGDRYVVVTSVPELRAFLESLGFENLPKASGR
jgi:hypothetical protein